MSDSTETAVGDRQPMSRTCPDGVGLVGRALRARVAPQHPAAVVVEDPAGDDAVTSSPAHDRHEAAAVARDEEVLDVAAAHARHLDGAAPGSPMTTRRALRPPARSTSHIRSAKSQAGASRSRAPLTTWTARPSSSTGATSTLAAVAGDAGDAGARRG